MAKPYLYERTGSSRLLVARTKAGKSEKARLLLVSILASFALASPSPAVAEPDPAGLGSFALPAFSEVALPVRPGYSTAIAVDAGYGRTEAIAGEAAGHDRLSGSLAGALKTHDWLLLSVQLHGRVDFHPEEDGEPDSGATGVPALKLRAFSGTNILWGAELGVQFPGADAPSLEIAATTPEVRGLFAYESLSGLTLGANLGYRLDNSAASAPDPSALRRGDRIALGVSEYDAALIALGVGYQLGASSVFWEASADVLLGAADLATSPMRATAGFRHAVSRPVQLEARAALALSKRPSVASGSELIPIEPRFSAMLGLRYAFGTEAISEPKPSARKGGLRENHDREEATRPPVESSAPRTVRGTIEATDGRPLAQVRVTLRFGSQRRETMTDDKGRFEFEDVPPGSALLEAETVDYDPVRSSIEVARDGKDLEVPKLTMDLQALGAQIQGLVQTFGGKPLVASITITPPGAVHQSDAEGRFTIDVTPGEYEVLIAAEGYVLQKHKITVGEKAVVVVNAELRKAQ